MASFGALLGIPAFLGVILAASGNSVWLFGAGTLFIGFGAGLFGHGTLTATMNLAPKDQTGLALGAGGRFRPQVRASLLLWGVSYTTRSRLSRRRRRSSTPRWPMTLSMRSRSCC